MNSKKRSTSSTYLLQTRHCQITVTNGLSTMLSITLSENLSSCRPFHVVNVHAGPTEIVRGPRVHYGPCVHYLRESPGYPYLL